MIEPTCVAELYADPDFDFMVAEYSTHANKKFPKPQYKQEDYQRMESAGALCAWRVMVDGKLVGFITILISGTLHFGGEIGIVESFFVLKSHRFTGMGDRMLAHVESYSKNRGLSVVVVQCPFASKLKRLLEKREYTPEIICYCLSL